MKIDFDYLKNTLVAIQRSREAHRKHQMASIGPSRETAAIIRQHGILLNRMSEFEALRHVVDHLPFDWEFFQ